MAGKPEEGGRGSWAEQVRELDSAIAEWELRKGPPKPTDWHEIADRLAGRLMYQTGQCPGHSGRRQDCPFCADDDAYRAYVKAGGTVRDNRSDGTVAVPLEEILARDDG